MEPIAASGKSVRTHLIGGLKNLVEVFQKNRSRSELYLQNAHAREVLRDNLSPEHLRGFHADLAKNGWRPDEKARTAQPRGAVSFRFTVSENSQKNAGGSSL